MSRLQYCMYNFRLLNYHLVFCWLYLIGWMVVVLPIVSERTPTRKERKKVHPMVKEPTIAE
jgi:hypothetical protein